MGRTSGSGRRLAGGCAAALVFGLTAWPAVPAFGGPVDAWQPADGGVEWGPPAVNAVPADEVPGCVGSRSAWHSGAEVVTLIALDCGDAAAAAGVVANIALSTDLAGAPGVAPVLGEGIDVALTTAEGNLDRYWSQGTRYLGVGTSCGARDCVAATAGYLRELVALTPAAPNRVWPNPATGPVTGFVPSGGRWALAADATLPSANLRVVDCALARERQWRGDGRVVAMVSVVECGTPELAFRAWSDLWSGLATRPVEAGVLGAGIDGAGTWQVDDQRIGYGRAWVQGTSYAYVHRICPTDDLAACRDATAVDAARLAGLLPGEPVPDSRAWNLALRTGLLLFVVPIGTLVVLLAARSAWRLLRERGWPVAPAPAEFTVVDGEVRRARAGRWLRGAAAALLVAGGYVAGVLWTTGTGQPLLFGAWVFLSPVVLVPAAVGVLRLVWRPHRLVRVARGPRGRPDVWSVAGAGLRAAAGTTAVLALLGYIACAVLFLLVTYQTPQATRNLIASMLASGDAVAVTVGTLLGFAAELERDGLMPVLFLAVLAGPMALAYLLDRLGRRLAQRSLPAVLAADTRPHLLYLRGFEEDDLRITPSLARTGFLQWLSPFGRPRFEEVLVRYLARFGPVIAIAGQSGRALPELGAAKASFADDQWRDKVHAWMGEALAVVVAATPDRVRDGLLWELVQLSDAERRPRVLLVTAPWPRDQLRARWQGFLAAASRLPLFAALAERGFPAGVQVMTFTTRHGWRGYGASRRWDWTYAASLVAAVEEAAPVWEVDRLAEATVRIDPDALPAPPPSPPASEAAEPEHHARPVSGEGLGTDH